MSGETAHDQIKDFFDWRYHAREFYSNIAMLALSNSPVSLNFTRDTISAQDSNIFGLVLGSNDRETGDSSVTLYNVSLPNRNSPDFDKSHPNPEWGKFNEMSYFSYKGELHSCDVNPKNDDIVVCVSNQIVLLNDGWDSTITIDDGEHAAFSRFLPNSNLTQVLYATSDNTVYSLKDGMGRPERKRKFKNTITDLSIDPYNEKIFISAHKKKKVSLVDMRDDSKTKIRVKSPINSLAFATHIPFLFVAGSSYGVIYFYDSRIPINPLFTVTAHDAAVTHLKWSHFHRDIIASSSMDSAVALWSLKEANESEPEAVFAHNGHFAPIVSFDWCHDQPWVLTSVSEDKLFEVFTIAPSQIEDYLYP